MVMTKPELIGSLQHEVRVLLHLTSKIEPSYLDYRPSPKQRSLIELLRYLAILGPIHLRLCMRDEFSMDAVGEAWQSGEASAKALGLEEVTKALQSQLGLFAEVLTACSEEDLTRQTQMFGSTASRGLWLVRLVLMHYPAYRMQLFLYLKACGREELSTMNLWMGMDAPGATA